MDHHFLPEMLVVESLRSVKWIIENDWLECIVSFQTVCFSIQESPLISGSSVTRNLMIGRDRSNS